MTFSIYCSEFEQIIHTIGFAVIFVFIISTVILIPQLRCIATGTFVVTLLCQFFGLCCQSGEARELYTASQ